MDENKEPVVNTEQKSNGGKTTKIAVIVAAIVIVCFAAYFGITKVVIPNKNYNAAVALMNDGKYEEAIAAFEAMNGYKDSAEMITACETGIKDDAYDAAIALMNEGKYEEAIAAFETLDDYKDSTDKINECKLCILKKAEVGDLIEFGAYEQDNDTSNGKEPIEWLVLERDGDKVLVISKYALDCKRYNTKYEDVTWETCTLRTWLNETFLLKTFRGAERSIIQTTKVSADRNPYESTDPGNATEDQIFLLSINEAEKYFTSDEARRCVPTAYAIANGAYTNDNYNVDGAATCRWWLRSPDFLQSFAARVYDDGGVRSYGGPYVRHYVSDDNYGVRPAMWIDLDALG